jgi:UDP-N-acetylmuramyl pentapeptide synthase
LPEVLILEMGVSDKKDMKYLLSIFRPNITIITEITQKYLEGFSGMDEMAGEYALLAAKTKPSGLLVLNNDNLRLRTLSENSAAPVLTFGFNESSDYCIIKAEKKEKGTEVEIKQEQGVIKELIPVFGAHHAQALAIKIIVNKFLEKYYDKKKEGYKALAK